jgi:hypothetical protein
VYVHAYTRVHTYKHTHVNTHAYTRATHLEEPVGLAELGGGRDIRNVGLRQGVAEDEVGVACLYPGSWLVGGCMFVPRIVARSPIGGATIDEGTQQQPLRAPRQSRNHLTCAQPGVG